MRFQARLLARRRPGRSSPTTRSAPSCTGTTRPSRPSAGPRRGGDRRATSPCSSPAGPGGRRGAWTSCRRCVTRRAVVGRVPRAPQGRVQVPVHVTDTPLFDDHGEHVATIGVDSDITDQLAERGHGGRGCPRSSNPPTTRSSRTTLDGSITHLEPLRRRAVRPSGRRDHRRAPAGAGSAGTVRRRWTSCSNVSASARASRGSRPCARRADGTDFHVSMSMSPLRDASGAVIGASTIARDISERVELTRQVEEDRRRLADAQASAMLGSFEIDLATGEVARSDELNRILGCEPGSAARGRLRPTSIPRTSTACARRSTAPSRARSGWSAPTGSSDPAARCGGS